MKAFYQCEIGEQFVLQISKGVGVKSDNVQYIVYEKLTPSTAKIVEQIGFDNVRSVGFIEPFTSQTLTYNVPEKKC